MGDEAILVTGGAGFIGSHVVERLLNDGFEVVAFDNFDPYYNPEVKRRNIARAFRSRSFRLVEGDIRSDEDVSALFRSNRFKTVIHLAARAGVRASLQEPVLYGDVNVCGTGRLLEAVRMQGGARFVFGSSSSVYGATSSAPFREDDSCDQPSSAYAATKRAGEIACYAHHHLYGFPVTCLRFFTVYGPRQRPEMAIHKFTRAIDLGEPLTFYGDGSSRRDYTYVADIVEGVVAAAQRSEGFTVYNLGTSMTTSLSELVSLIESRLGRKAVLDPRPEEPGDVPLTFADTTKAERELGYRPTVSLPDGLTEFVEWYRREKLAAERAIIDLRPRRARVAVIGSGYVGTVVAAGLSNAGHQVIGVEKDHVKLVPLRSGKAPFYEGGLDDLLQAGMASGRLQFTDDVGQAAAHSDSIFICVGTPARGDGGGADLSALNTVAVQIAPHLTDPTTRKDLIIKSTVPIGTGRWLTTRIEDLTGTTQHTRNFTVVNNPEFLREGSAVSDYLFPERVVLGSDDPTAIERVAEIYRPITEAPGRQAVPVFKTTPTAAEMAKYASNAFLATRVSFINEIANICEYLGADVTDVSAIMGLDSRIGPHYLDAGVGWGGSCFGKDLRALVTTASEHGYEPSVLNSVVMVNYLQRERVARQLTTILGGLRGRRVAVLGLAFKAGTDDLRDAPAVDVVDFLVERGAKITAYDPMVRSLPSLPELQLFTSPYEAAERAEAVVVMTDWPEIVDLDLERLAMGMSGRLLLDGRNIFPVDKVAQAGLIYQGIGRGARVLAAPVGVS